MPVKNWIETYTGRRFNLRNPRAKDVDIHDIARGLAMTARFGGHTDGFRSVAQHSIDVANLLLEPRVSLYGLLHDATEAYIGDVIRPLKFILPGYRRLEKPLMKVILKGLGLHKKLQMTKGELSLVKHADNIMLITERKYLKPKCQHPFYCRANGLQTTEPLGSLAPCLEWREAEHKFLSEYNLLSSLI